MSEETGTLVVIQPDEAFDVFTKPGATDPIIAQLRAFAAEAPKGVSTLKGRKAIAAFATKFVKSKTFLESFGKEIADDVKEIPKKVDAARKLLRDTCDELRDAVRKPLTEWEAAEDARVAGHRRVIEILETAGNLTSLNWPVSELLLALAEAAAVIPSNHEEFADEVERAKGVTVAAIEAAIAAREKFDADQAELAELRRQKVERDAAAAAAADAKAEADRIARIEADAAERARKAVEDAAQKEREAAAAREAEFQRQAFEAKRLQERAEQEARDTQARIEREAAATKAREEEERRAREANKAHRAKLNSEAKSDLILFAVLTEDQAKAVIVALAKRRVRHISLNY